MLIVLVLLNLSLFHCHEEDFECFEQHFPRQTAAENNSSSPYLQQVNIRQIYQVYDTINNNDTSLNTTLIKSEEVKLAEGDKINLTITSLAPSAPNPRNLILYFDGYLVQAAMGYHSHNVSSEGEDHQAWQGCRTVNVTAPEGLKILFAAFNNNAQIAELESLELDIIQNDASCFEESFPEMIKSSPNINTCERDKFQAVDIKHVVYYDYNDETTIKQMRLMLEKGRKEFVELISHTTNVTNPRYLVLLYDGYLVMGAVNHINQKIPTLSQCSTFNATAPNSWMESFATNVSHSDNIHVDILDPMNPWGEKEEDLECFALQFPDCKNETSLIVENGEKNQTIHMTHYASHETHYAEHDEITTVEVEKFALDIEEGVSKVVQIEYQNQSSKFENQNPRNLSLLLEGSKLKIGLGYLDDTDVIEYSSAWSCAYSSAVLDVNSEDTAKITFYGAWYDGEEEDTYVIHVEFLEFRSEYVYSGATNYFCSGYIVILCAYMWVLL